MHLSKAKSKSRTYYFDCLTRILYIYLKRHPEVDYCQGMNEVVSLIFYSFTNKNSEYFRRTSESDAYFCLEIMLAQLSPHGGNHFSNAHKNTSLFIDMLKRIDFRLYENLEQSKRLDGLGLASIQWFSSLFLKDLGIDDCLVLWDGFMGVICLQLHSKQEEGAMTLQHFMIYLGLGLVHLHRDQLWEGENPLCLFGKIGVKPEAMLEKAMNLYKIYHHLFV